MNKKTITTLLIILGVGIGYWLISPLFITNEVSEDVPVSENSAMEAESKSDEMVSMENTEGMNNDQEEASVQLSGNFEGRANHNAEGKVRIIESDGKSYIRFEDDFVITNGPDLFVHLGRDGEYNADLRLGELKGNKGSQNYEIPEGIDMSQFNEVWVWCRAFSIPFGVAELN